MAQRKVTPNSIVLTIAAISGTEKAIVCLTQNDYQLSNNAIDASSFCGKDQLPGTQTFDLTFSGQRVLAPDSTNTSEAGLFALAQNKTHVQWTRGPLTPVAGDNVIAGTGYLNQFSGGDALDAIPTMSGTINADSSSVVFTVHS